MSFRKSFKLKEIKPRIFFLEFHNYYDMAMHFLRYQEFYESSSPKFRGKRFEILDFMEWYQAEFGKGVFSYPRDWDGFNIPGETIAKVHSIGIIDHNKYDLVMYNLWMKCSEKYSDCNFYIIGAISQTTLEHEIAHALYYTNVSYKEEMNKLVKDLNPEFKKEFFSHLKQVGYCKKVFVDECQAYLSTGTNFKCSKSVRNPFIKLFNKYRD